MRDSQLIQKLLGLVKEERRITLEILHCLRDVEEREIHLEMGYSSLYEFTTRFLGYSEGAAYRRIGALRLIQSRPEVEDKIKSGEISLTVAAKAQTAIRQNQLEPDVVIEKVNNLSGREADRVLLELAPQPVPPEKIRPLTTELTEARLILDKELMTKLNELKALLSHVNPNMSYVELVKYLADFALKKLPQSRTATSPPKSHRTNAPSKNPRYISPSVRREVWYRDQGRCTFTDPRSGHQCGATHLLEIDHVIPFAQGGSADPENLRLLCKAHNLYRARRQFGPRTQKARFSSGFS